MIDLFHCRLIPRTLILAVVCKPIKEGFGYSRYNVSTDLKKNHFVWLTDKSTCFGPGSVPSRGYRV